MADRTTIRKRDASPYNAAITREQFLFYEMRATAKLTVEGFGDENVVEHIVCDNLFQYPTEKSVRRMALACIRRLEALEDKTLVGPMLFESKVSIYYILGLLNSSVNRYMVKILNPTLSLQIGDMNNIPFICNENIKEQVISNVKENISLSKTDWDSRETSWDFERHPLV